MTSAGGMLGTARRPADPGPTRTADRLLVLDVLRGFALLGILLANIHLISGVSAAARMESAADTSARWLSAILVDGSFFPLFSFMFGLGLAIQMQRAEQRRRVFVRGYLRRLAFLMVIAIAHWFLVWDAMILIAYAALGVPLLLFRNGSGRTLLVAAAVCLVLQTFAYPLTRITDEAVGVRSNALALLSAHQEERFRDREALVAQRTSRLANGSYAEAMRERGDRFARTFSRPSRYYPWVYGSIFAMFLLGVYAGRRRILASLDEHQPLVRRVVWIGLVVGLTAKLAALAAREMIIPAWGSPTHLAAVGLERIGGPALGFFYAALIALALRHPRGVSLLSPLAPVGRMALSNYIVQSLLATAIFYGHGLGLYGRVGIATGLLVAAGIFLVQLPLSAWWMSHFRFGPVEWAWRSATYWRLQPMRLRRSAPAVVPSETVH